MAPTSAAKWVACHSGAKDKATGRLVAFADAPSWFRPSLTPREMLLKGMHGGIYFNPKGGKPGVKYPRSKFPKGIPGVTIDEYPKEWFKDVPKEKYLSRRYSTTHNCYGVKSGLDQAGWESSGWITEHDPRGWTQWYFRFFMGRRLKDGEDERQMSRWNGVCGLKGRWKQNLIGKCLAGGRAHDDVSVSPVVRQTLLHWAFELGEADFASGAKRVKTHGATYMPREQLAGVLTAAAARKRKAGWDDDAADGDDERTKASAAEQSDERKRRAERRALGEASSSGPGSAGGRTRAPAVAATGTRGAQESGAESTAKRRRKTAAAAAPAEEELSPYEKARDEQKARNAAKLKELGLA
jgi:hypothetical protein